MRMKADQAGVRDQEGLAWCGVVWRGVGPGLLV